MAAGRGSRSEDRLAIASSVGKIAGDWPLAMLLIFGLDRSIKTQSVMQHDPHYTTAAYPPAYARLIAAAADANGVPPELLYAVIRRESLFFPDAVSRRGALGLFQFIPSTFATLDSRWKVLGGSGMTSMEAYLHDPGLAIALGARWFGDELLERNDGDILLAVMEHNAGYPAVKAWREAWERAGRGNDIEYMIETARFAETRIFARSVLADMVLTEAIGLFKTD
jgi:soluble lytic murein transglycosylase